MSNELKQIEELEVPQGHCITLFFPDECDLEPATIRGPMPRKGDMIYVRGDIGRGMLIENGRYDYELQKSRTMNCWLRRWVVVDAYFSTMIFSNTMLDRIRTYEMRAEVRLAPIWAKIGPIGRIRRWFRQRKRRKNAKK